MRTLKASPEGLRKIKEARKEKGWAIDDLRWLDEISKYLPPEKNRKGDVPGEISVGTWKRFLYRTRAIKEDNFRACCQALGLNWKEIVDRTPQPTTNAKAQFRIYDDCWVGREPIIAKLKEQLEGSCRVLILVGLTGIGKTALAEKLATELYEDFLQGDWKGFIRRNFDDREQSSDFASVAAKWLEDLGEPITSEDRINTQQLLDRLVKYLAQHQRLVLVDSLEEILQGNEEDGWSDFQDEWWVKFFNRVLTTESFQSRIVLTSQDLPRQVEEAGTRSSNFWHSKIISGLNESERLQLFEKTLFEKKELKIEEAGSPERLYLERIGNAYEGHPLALRVISGEIDNRPFDGDIVAYWNKYGNEIEVVEKAIEEAKTKGVIAGADDNYRLHRSTKELRKKVRQRLEATFERLKEQVKSAYILLCTSSIYRLAVEEELWLSHLEDWDYDENQQESALDVLRDRYLVEEVVREGEYLLRQHNLVRGVSLEHFKKLDDEE